MARSTLFYCCFSDVYNSVPQFKRLSDFSKKVRNIFGSVRHSPKAMFETYSRQHNNGIYLGFIKPLECRMAGEHIVLLCLLRLKNALRSTIMSKEFIDLRIFHADCTIIMNPNFWRLLFVMCRALYVPMRVLRLADQKTPAMDKLCYYVLQTDQMLPKYLDDAKERSTMFLTDSTISVDHVSTSGLNAARSEDAGEDKEDDDKYLMAPDDGFEIEEDVDSDDEQ